MAEFSAHRVTVPEPTDNRVTISTHMNLYVSTLGDDVLNSGIEEGSPFRTPARAIRWLGDKLITETGFVTINFRGGIYDIEDELVFDHDQGNRVAFVGTPSDVLLLQTVKYYKSYDIGLGFTGVNERCYSAVSHGITLTCVRPSDSSGFTALTGSNSISSAYGFSGAGVLIEDYDLVFDEDYNPIYCYAAYPFHPRNNISRCSSILGAHKLTGVSGENLSLISTIRDSWVGLPHAMTGTGDGGWARYYGNQMDDLVFYNASRPFGVVELDLSLDTPELTPNSNSIFNLNNFIFPNALRGHYLSSVPKGYYGLTATTGIPIGATANVVGATFPTGQSILGATATYYYQGITASGIIGWYTYTGANGSFLNDTILFGNNYHEHNPQHGWVDGAYPLSSVNTNRLTVKIVPTVFRRFGNILKIGGGGLRKIKDIFFDGVDMLAHYKLFGTFSSGASNKAAIYAVNCRLGESVPNEPEGLGYGLCSNSGAKDFHVGFYADRGTDAVMGKFIASNCSYGIIANNGSSVQTVGSVSTGSAACGFGALNSSSMVADRCFASFCGQSLVTLRIKSAGFTLDNNSYIPGQTFISQETFNVSPTQRSGGIKGTVWEWDPRDKVLKIAVRAGYFEAVNPYLQGITGAITN